MNKKNNYEDDEFEEDQSSGGFYHHNKLFIWILILIILIVLAIKFTPEIKKFFNGDDNSSTKNIVFTIEPTESVVIGKGNTTTLAAKINVDNASITWSSNDEVIAKVINGNVTGINKGKTTIMATYIDSSGSKYTAIKEVEVVEGDPNITLTSVNFQDGDLYMPLSKEYQLGLILTPTNASVSDKIFTSSDPNVATVTNDGIVKGVAEGYTRIIATVNGKYKTAIDVYVSSNYNKSEIVISPTTISFNSSSRKIKVGDSETLSYYIAPSQVDRTKLTFSSSNPSVVTVDASGKITALSEGTTVITLSSINGRKDEMVVEVYNDIIDVDSIELSVDTINMEAGKTEIITPIVLPNNASNKGLSYSSSDLDVVTVTPNVDGTVAILSALKKGTATVTIKSGNVEKKLTINVTGEGNNSEVEEDPKVPTTIVVRSDKNNLAKTYEAAKKIPVSGIAHVSITMRSGVGMIKYCINKYGSSSCTPNKEMYSNDTIDIPNGDIYVLRIIKYDYADNEISSSSENYIDGVLNYYINTTGSVSYKHTVTGAYATEALANASPVVKNSKVEIKVNSTDRYIKTCATSTTSACSPNLKVTSNYSYTLNKVGTWHIIVNEFDKDNNQIGNSKVYYAKVEDEVSENNGDVKVSNLKINTDANGKYLSVDVESNVNFFNTRFCYTMVNKDVLGTCNLDTKSSAVPHYSNGSVVRPKEEMKTYYATLSSTKKYTFKFYLDGLDKLFNENDTKHDVIFEFAVKSSKGFSKPIKIRINMTSKSGKDSSWKSTFIK